MRTRFGEVSPPLVIAVALLAGCLSPARDHVDEILEQGRLRLITANNPHCYYIYRDSPAGFEYDLAHAFASSLGVEL